MFGVRCWWLDVLFSISWDSRDSRVMFLKMGFAGVTSSLETLPILRIFSWPQKPTVSNCDPLLVATAGSSGHLVFPMLAGRKDQQPPEPALFFALAMRHGLPDRPAMNETENLEPKLVKGPNHGFQIAGPSGTDLV